MKLGKGNTAKMDTEELKWRTKDDVRTLKEAEEIKKDPERLKRAMVMSQEELENIKSFVVMMKTKKS